MFVGVTVGSNNENANQHGLSHFLEHACYMDTGDSGAIKKESLGLESNAFTENEMTVYHIDGDAKHTEEMIHIESKMLNPLFPNKKLENEKGVIVEEIKRYEDSTERKSTEAAQLELFKGTEAGHFILGTIDSVKSFE